MNQSQPDFSITTFRDLNTLISYNPTTNQITSAKLLPQNTISHPNRHHRLQKTLTDSLITSLNANINTPIHHLISQLAHSLIHFCDQDQHIYTLDKIIYLTLRYYQVRAYGLQIEQSKGFPTSMLVNILAQGAKLFEQDFYNSQIQKQQHCSNKSIKMKANMLRNSGFFSGSGLDRKNGYKNVKQNNRYFELIAALENNELNEVYEKIERIQATFGKYEAQEREYIKSNSAENLRFVKKMLMRRILWNQKKIQKETVKSESSMHIDMKQQNLYFNRLNSLMRKVLQNSQKDKGKANKLGQPPSQGIRQITQQLLQAISIIRAVLLGNEEKIRQFSDKNLYLYLKLVFYYGQDGLNFKKIDEVAKQYWAISHPNAGKLPTIHLYMMYLFSDKNYHKTFQVLKSILSATPHYQFYLEFLGCLSFHLQIPKVFVKYFDPEYYINMISRMLVVSDYEQEDAQQEMQDQQQHIPKLLINTASLVQYFFLPKYNAQQLTLSNQQNPNLFSNLIELLIAKNLKQKPIQEYRQLHWLANLTSCAINARMIHFFIPFYERLVERHLKRGLDEYALQVIGIELCAHCSQIEGDYYADQEDGDQQKNHDTTYLRGNKLHFPLGHKNQQPQQTILKDYLFKKFNVNQGNETIIKNNEVPQPLNNSKTFAIFKDNYLTKQTFNQPFNYQLLNKVDQLTDQKSLLHLKNGQIAYIFKNYFKNYFILKQVKQLNQKFTIHELQKLKDGKQFNNACENLIKREKILLQIMDNKNGGEDCGQILRMTRTALNDYSFLQGHRVQVTIQRQISQNYDQVYKLSMELIGCTREYIHELQKKGIEFEFMKEMKSSIY